MLSVSAMALFCEDIREEKGDTVTLVGLLPDTVTIEQPTSNGGAEQTTKLISKLCVYVRVNFDPDMRLEPPKIWLVMPDGERLGMGSVTPEIIQKAQSESKAKGNLLAGIVSRVIMAGFRPLNGSVKVEVDVGDETILAGALTFNLAQ